MAERNERVSVAPETKARLLAYQKNEITEYHIYSQLAQVMR